MPGRDIYPLKRADGIHILVEWGKFRRVYASEGGYAVTLANEQEIKGQLEFAIVDPDGVRYDLQSISEHGVGWIGQDCFAICFICRPEWTQVAASCSRTCGSHVHCCIPFLFL